MTAPHAYRPSISGIIFSINVIAPSMTSSDSQLFYTISWRSFADNLGIDTISIDFRGLVSSVGFRFRLSLVAMVAILSSLLLDFLDFMESLSSLLLDLLDFMESINSYNVVEATPEGGMEVVIPRPTRFLSRFLDFMDRPTNRPPNRPPNQPTDRPTN